MDFFKQKNYKLYENIGFLAIIIFIIIQSVINHDYYISTISAICGISYTILAGQGKWYCYILGLTGSVFYGILAFKNALWGNLSLYVLYYVPMQILGFFRWRKHLKPNSDEIIKSNLSVKKTLLLYSIALILILISTIILYNTGDSHPILDSIITIMSLVGMYLSVNRLIEQWAVWFVVNVFSLIMWIFIAKSGVRAYSTIIMWVVYIFLAIYFYYQWKKEINKK